MKHLIDYIKESKNISEGKSEAAQQSEVQFNIDGLEETKELKKKLEDYEDVTIEDDMITVVVKVDNDDTKEIYDILKDYTKSIRTSSKRSSNEEYAQKTLAFENTLAAMYTQMNPPEENEDDEDKKEDE